MSRFASRIDKNVPQENSPLEVSYCTTSVNPVAKVVEPLVAFTVMLYAPVGVGVTAGGGGGAGAEPPPPQPGNRIIKPSSAIRIGRRRRPGAASTIENSIKSPKASQ